MFTEPNQRRFGVSTFKETEVCTRKRKRTRIKNGMDAFKYSFFKKRRSDAHRFFAGMMKEVRKAKPLKTTSG